MGEKAAVRRAKLLVVEKELRDARYIFLASLQAPGKTLHELREILSVDDARFLRFFLDMEEKGLIRAQVGNGTCSNWLLTQEGEKELLEHLRER
jgi:DNA-binding MarR family transcriptional regulator